MSAREFRNKQCLKKQWARKIKAPLFHVCEGSHILVYYDGGYWFLKYFPRVCIHFKGVYLNLLISFKSFIYWQKKRSWFNFLNFSTQNNYRELFLACLGNRIFPTVLNFLKNLHFFVCFHRNDKRVLWQAMHHSYIGPLDQICVVFEIHCVCTFSEKQFVIQVRQLIYCI